MSKRILVIGHTWPQPQSTAAGSRMMQLLQSFLKNDYEVHFACASPYDAYSRLLESKQITVAVIQLNSNTFNDYIIALHPDIVMFDRYITHEQYGWRVQECVPNALTILDTEDLHFLRAARQYHIEKQVAWSNDLLHNATTTRELASILTCDLTLVISEYEMELLQSHFKIDICNLVYLPFMLPAITSSQQNLWKSFSQRRDFMTIGSFLHKPNVDAVYQLKKEIWPLIKKQLPDAQLHIYGSYPSQHHLQMTSQKDGFIMKGATVNALETIAKYRVLVAPLRYGAGLKGKLIDAMQTGTPAVMSSIASEAIYGDLPVNGMVANTTTDFVTAAVHLHQDAAAHKIAASNGARVINERFNESAFAKALILKITATIANLTSHRSQSFMRSLLLHHAFQSSKYMSKWIEEKNKNAT